MIDLYAAGTGNGLRASLALAESGLEYRVHKVDLAAGGARTPAFLALNPAGQIPVIVDHDGPDGKPLTLAQSGAIVLYLAGKTGRWLPQDPARRALAMQWFMQAASDVAGTGSALFQVEVAAQEKVPAIIERFRGRLRTYFAHADAQLAGREYLVGEFSVADLALYPAFNSRRVLAEGLPDLARWAATMAARPATARGMTL